MLMALFLGFRRIWVFGSFYSEMQADRDQWKAVALRSLMTAEKSVHVAETAVKNGTK